MFLADASPAYRGYCQLRKRVMDYLYCPRHRRQINQRLRAFGEQAQTISIGPDFNSVTPSGPRKDKTGDLEKGVHPAHIVPVLQTVGRIYAYR